LHNSCCKRRLTSHPSQRTVLPASCVLPGAEQQAADKRFLEALAARDEARAVSLFEEIAIHDTPLTSRRLSQLLLLLCDKKLHVEASDLLAALSSTGSDQGVVPAFIHVIDACSAAGATDLALKHLQQADELQLCIGLPACRSLMVALYDSDEPAAAVLSQLQQVLDYMNAHSLHPATDMYSMLLSQAVQAADMTAALRIAQLMTQAEQYPTMAVCRRLLRSLREQRDAAPTTAAAAAAQAIEQQIRSAGYVPRTRKPVAGSPVKARHTAKPPAAVRTASDTSNLTERCAAEVQLAAEGAIELTQGIQAVLDVLKPMVKRACARERSQREAELDDVEERMWAVLTTVTPELAELNEETDSDAEDDSDDELTDADSSEQDLHNSSHISAEFRDSSTRHSSSLEQWDSDDSCSDTDEYDSDSDGLLQEFAAEWGDADTNNSSVYDADTDSEYEHDGSSTHSSDPYSKSAADRGMPQLSSDLATHFDGVFDTSLLWALQNKVMYSWYLPDTVTNSTTNSSSSSSSVLKGDTPVVADDLLSQLCTLYPAAAITVHLDAPKPDNDNSNRSSSSSSSSISVRAGDELDDECDDGTRVTKPSQLPDKLDD
jgi:hypothetical protein